MAQSEQILSLVRLAEKRDDTAGSPAACCCNICPRARTVASVRASTIPIAGAYRDPGGSVKPEELTDQSALDDPRLFHEEDEVRTLPMMPLRRGCRCDPDEVLGIACFPADEREAMVGDDA